MRSGHSMAALWVNYKKCIKNKYLCAAAYLRLFPRHGWKLLVARALCAGVLVFHGWGIDAAATGVTVTPTGYDIASVDPDIAWIDNNQLLFIGKKSNSDPKKGSFSSARMYIWNEATKSVREHGEAISFCYSDGWIRYGAGKKDEAGNRIVYAGPLGKEEVVKVLAAPSTRRRASRGCPEFCV